MLLLAMILDALLGEPRWIWSRLAHPAVAMGRLISSADRRFNHGAQRRLKGLLFIAALVAGTALAGAVPRVLPFGDIITILAAAILLAQRSLAEHVTGVADAMHLSTHAAREAVARIVGRDTAAMDDAAIARSAIESAAENLSDGVIAPAFWFAVAGLPGMLAYKAVNTADSMIGHRTERHDAFGWAAARLDDVLNWIPARLSASIIASLYGQLSAWKSIRADAALHRSPNAGWPEAAMARALDVALSGPRSYNGRMQDFPFVHANGRRDLGPADIHASVRVLWRVWTALFAIALLIAMF